jgi:hypothetical protein
MKPKKCCICNDWFTPKYKTTEKACSISCAITHATNLRERKDKLNWQKEKKKRTDELKTHSDWSKELQIEINTIVRLIDKGAPCISSLRNGNEQRQAGHRWSVGSSPSLRFNFFNIFGQTAEQNNYQSGNPDGFDHGISCIYGDEILNEVHGLKKKYPILKLSIPELIHAKARAKKIVKGLKELNATFTPEQRIELRRKYNKILGLYEK